MKTRRTLITSPLEWQMSAVPVPHPTYPVMVQRGGTELRTPRPTVIVDTREQHPFSFARFQGWFAGIERQPLRLGDYSVVGLEEICTVERKDLSDLVRSFTVERCGFVERLRRMSRYPQRLLVITAALSQVKSPYPFSAVKPNVVIQSLMATFVGLGVPFLSTESHELGEELVASCLYQTFLYHWLEHNDYGRFLMDGDL